MQNSHSMQKGHEDMENSTQSQTMMYIWNLIHIRNFTLFNLCRRSDSGVNLVLMFYVCNVIFALDFIVVNKTS